MRIVKVYNVELSDMTKHDDYIYDKHSLIYFEEKTRFLDNCCRDVISPMLANKHKVSSFIILKCIL